MDICQAVFGKAYSDLTTEEYRRFRQLTRKANYFRHYDQNRRTLRESRQAFKQRLIAALELVAACQRCGYDRYIGALDFHHTNPEEKSFSNFNGVSFSTALEESKKCELICANCHREHHAEEERKTPGRPRRVDPLLEKYLRAAGLSEEKIQNAMTGRIR